MISVEVARDLDALRDEWRALHAASLAPPFLSWEWASRWHRHLAPDRKAHVMLAREKGRLVGLLPIAEEELPLGRIKRLSFLGERWAGADYLDVLALPGRKEEVAEATLSRLFESRGFDVLDLDHVAAHSSTVALAVRLAGDRFAMLQAPRFTCPRVLLDGGWRDVLKRSKRADNFKRRLRKLRAMDGFERRVVVAPNEVREAFDRFLALHEKRWEVQGGSDAMGRPAIVDFHRDLVVELAKDGKVRFEEIWVEGQCRASIYGLDGKETYSFYQTGYDPDWSRHSVGLVCLGLSIEEALGRGAKHYDFLRGSESYKFDWATDSQQTISLRFFARSLGSTLWRAREGAEAAARAAAHALLPEAAVGTLRRLRRARERQLESTRGGR